jgi:hypothetical protein
MTEKPDDKTWYEHVYEGRSNDEIGELHDEFFEVMADKARAILEECRLDETRYEVEVVNRTQIGATDDWLMDEQEDAEELRDVLAGHGIGDESVGVFVTPRSSEGEISDIPPDHVPVDEYTVYVELQRIQSSLDGALQRSKDRINETLAEEMERG